MMGIFLEVKEQGSRAAIQQNSGCGFFSEVKANGLGGKSYCSMASKGIVKFLSKPFSSELMLTSKRSKFD